MKKRLYGKYGVEEYWIVDPKNHSISIYALNDGVLVETSVARKNERIQSSVLTDLDLEVDKVFNI